MTDSKHPAVSLKRQFDEVKRSIQSMRSSMTTPTFESLRHEERLAFETSSRASTDRPLSVDLVPKFDGSHASRLPITPLRPEINHHYSYVKTLEDENAGLKRRLAVVEADRAAFDREVNELKAQALALQAKVAKLERENAHLKVPILTHTVSASGLTADTSKLFSLSPSVAAKSASLLTPPDSKRPSSCIRGTSSTPKKQRVAFNKDLKVAHYHSDDFRIFELPSHPLKDEKPNFSQSSYTARTSHTTSPNWSSQATVTTTYPTWISHTTVPQAWTSEGYRVPLSTPNERRIPYSVVRY